jgi:hypothetical protein
MWKKVSLLTTCSGASVCAEPFAWMTILLALAVL